MSAGMWFLVGVIVGALPTITEWVQHYADVYAQRKRLQELEQYQAGWDACSKYLRGDE